MTEDEKVEWHHWPNGHESEQTPGDAEGRGSLACCSPWNRKQLDRTEQEQEQQQQLKLFSVCSDISTSSNFSH